MVSVRVHVWEAAELEFAAETSYDNCFLEVELQVEFCGPRGEKLRVPGFWDGANVWKVRFAPVTAGEWSWHSVCNHAGDAGLHGRSGVLAASAWSAAELADNPNRRGFIRVHEDGRYFKYADGTSFYWLGDTLWAAHTARCDLQEALPTYLEDRRAKGFTVIQLAVGHPAGDASSEDCSGYVNYAPGQYLNEGGAPYVRRYERLNPAYFQWLDKRIKLMTEYGFALCLMGMWGQELQAMGVAAAKLYLKYIVARYAAYNVCWSPAGEYLFTADVEGWRELGREIDRCDPYGHPTSVHSIAPHSGSRHFHAEHWYDFNLIQVGHVLAFKNYMEMLPYLDYRLEPHKPAIMSESWYENHPNRVLDDGVRIGDRDIRFAAYVSLLQGCVGQTYGAHGVWSFYDGTTADQWGEDERPDIWKNDLVLPGAAQMKHLRSLMESLQWWRLEPHPEWASTIAGSSVYCAAVPRSQYVVYCTGSESGKSVPVLLMIMDSEGEEYEGQWFNPRTGEWSLASGQYHAYGSGWMWRTFTPDSEDWILTLHRRRGAL